MNITEYIAATHNVNLSQAIVYLRKNLIAVDANERYYHYVGKRSAAPFDSLVHPEDVEQFVEALHNLQEEECVQFMIRISNLEDGYRMVYASAQISNRVEDGQRLYALYLHDVVNMTEDYMQLSSNIHKYIRFLMLSNLYFYEYAVNTGAFKIYKFINDKIVVLVDSRLDEWCEAMSHSDGATQNVINGLYELRDNLKKGVLSFEMQIEEMTDSTQKCKIKGLPFRFTDGQQLSVGIINSGNINLKEAYYMTAGARDAATGLLNKKAMVEYIINALRKRQDQTSWLIVLDIDDFKTINDNFGHLFGDKVIQVVADTLTDVFESYGVVGRFGGDEFFVMVEGIETEEDVRLRLKTLAKHLLVAFADDPQHNIKITTSMGVANYPLNGRDYEELFAKADKALYIAKDKGKKRYIIYNEAMHDNYSVGDSAVRTVAYTISGEKRTSVLSRIVNELALKGKEALASGDLQRLIVEVFDLDGITIYAKGGRERISVTGQYHQDIDVLIEGYIQTGYYKSYNENGIGIDGSMNVIMSRNQNAYEYLARTEIGAFVHSISYKEESPEIFISFDIFNRNRKWSDVDVEELSIIGKLIGTVLLN